MATDTPKGGALVRRENVLVPEVITNPAEFKEHLDAWKQRGYHILTPQADFGSLPPGWKIIPAVCFLNPNPDAGDVYRDRLFCGADEVAPSKTGLRKIARTGGLSWETKRTDSNTVQRYWAASARIEYWGFDGQRKHAEASYEWDLRDGAARVYGMSDKELRRALMNGWRRCEAGAINAAIREYGLKQKYAVQELQRPFIVMNMVFEIDRNDPAQVRMQAQSVLGAKGLLFAGTDEPFHPTHANPEATVGERFDPKSAQEEEIPFEQLEPEKPEEPATPRFKILSVAKVKDTDDYFVTATDEKGVEKRLHTSIYAVAATCNKAKLEGKSLPIVTDQNEIVEIEAEAKDDGR